MKRDILAGRLRVLMDAANYTCRSLAAKTGLPPNTISDLSRGRVGERTAYMTFERIAGEFGITVSQLVGDAPLELNNEFLDTIQSGNKCYFSQIGNTLNSHNPSARRAKMRPRGTVSSSRPANTV